MKKENFTQFQLAEFAEVPNKFFKNIPLSIIEGYFTKDSYCLYKYKEKSKMYYCTSVVLIEQGRAKLTPEAITCDNSSDVLYIIQNREAIYQQIKIAEKNNKLLLCIDCLEKRDIKHVNFYANLMDRTDIKLIFSN